MYPRLCLFVCTLLAAGGSLSAGLHGRFDLAPVVMDVKVQEQGHTIKTLDMVGARADATLQVVEGYGFVLKPFFMSASGGGDLIQGGINVGHYTPISEKISVTPIIGWSGSRLNTNLSREFYKQTMFVSSARERFHASSLNLGLEVAYAFTPSWILTGIYQYGFARTNTRITMNIPYMGDKTFYSKGHSQGSNAALVLDYYVTQNWIISAGAAYNNSLSKEKHGLKAFGGKLGIGYYY